MNRFQRGAAAFLASASLFMIGSAAHAKEAAIPDVKTIALTQAHEIDSDLDAEHREISELSRALVNDGAVVANQLAVLNNELNAHYEALRSARTPKEVAAQKERIGALRGQSKINIDGLTSQVKHIQDRARQLNSRYANLAARDAYKIVVHKIYDQGQVTKAIIGHPRDDIEFAFQRDEIQSAALIANAALERALDAMNQADAVLRSGT